MVNLRYAFQDDENCFFVLDLMLGGDLRCTCPIFSAVSFSVFLSASIATEWRRTDVGKTRTLHPQNGPPMLELIRPPLPVHLTHKVADLTFQ